MTLRPHEAAGGVLDGGEGLGQDLASSFLSPAATRARNSSVLARKLLVGQRLVGLLEFVDARDDGAAFLEELR
jgi:hypothetical protein